MINKFSISEKIFLAAGILFLGFILFLFSQVCFGYDEYLWKTMYSRMGFTGFFHHIYDSLSFRYSTHFYLYLTFNYASPATYRLFNFFSQTLIFLLMMISVYSAFKTYFANWLNYHLSGIDLLASTLITSAILYFLTSQIVEIYTYTSSFFSYFMPIAFFCSAIALVLKEKTKKLHILLLGLCAFSVGGSAENVSASIIGGSSIILLYFFCKMNFRLADFFRNSHIKKMLFFILLTFCFALIAYTAPGARNRAAQEATNTLLKSNPIFAPQALDVFVTKFFHLSNLTGLIFASWFLHLGKKTGIGRSPTVKKILWLSSIALISSVLIHLLITKAIFDSFGYLRIWFPVNFFFCIFIMCFFIFAGTRLNLLWTKLFSISGGVLSLLLISAYCIRHAQKIHKFSSTYFERPIDIMAKCKNQGEEIISKPLENPDILYFDKFVRFPEDSLSTYFCIFNEIPCKNVYIK